MQLFPSLEIVFNNDPGVRFLKKKKMSVACNIPRGWKNESV